MCSHRDTNVWVGVLIHPRQLKTCRNSVTGGPYLVFSTVPTCLWGLVDTSQHILLDRGVVSFFDYGFRVQNATAVLESYHVLHQQTTNAVHFIDCS
jgi:hypothetical protein